MAWIEYGSITVPLDPAAPARRNSESGVWPAEGVKIAPKLVRFSQMAPDRIVLPEAAQSKEGVPVMRPATSRLPFGRVPEAISACTPSFSSAFTVAGKATDRVVVRMS